MKKRLLSMLLAVTLLFGSAAALPENVFTGDTSITVSADDCIIPNNAKEFNGHYYCIYNDSVNWDTAKIQCETLGGHLATITSSEEQSFIESINSNNRRLWIGGYRDDNYNWYWVTGEPWGYTNWDDGEPNNSSNVISNEKCVAVWPKYWNDLNNRSREQSGFICEWDNIEGVDDSQLVTTTDVEFRYDGREYEFYYSDNILLSGVETVNKTDEPNEKIAKFASRLALAAYDKDAIIKCLKTMGFKSDKIKDYGSYSFMPTYSDNDRVAYNIAYKKVKGKHIFIIPIRGTHGNCEWLSDFNLGTDYNTHAGFYKAAGLVKANLIKEMKNRNADSKNTILFFTGHSRGAAVANILAGEFSTSAMDLEGTTVDIPANQVLAYTFACPSVARKSVVDKSLNNIHNYNNPSDLIPALPFEEPLEQWGYDRYGKTHVYRLNEKQQINFKHKFYDLIGETYQGYDSNKELVAAVKKIAPTKEKYNTRVNQCLFKKVAFMMMDDDLKHLPSSKSILEKQLDREYPEVKLDNLIDASAGTFIYILLKKETSYLTILDAITHGHMCETYICLTDALFESGNDSGHSYTYFEYNLGFTKTKGERCIKCGKQYLVNYAQEKSPTLFKDKKQDLNLTFHRCEEDNKTYSLFTGVEVDGKKLSASNYTAKSGSLNLTLNKSYVSKLSAGTHTVKVLFKDGFSETSIYVADKANEPNVERLAGDNRYQTAAKISIKSNGFKSVSTVILASGLNYADALAGVPLATKINAPILLTGKDSLPDETLAEIIRLGAKNVIILGGEVAISAKVEKALKDNKLETERIAGQTRFETATKIAENLNEKPKEVFFVYGLNYADALSVSTVAALKNAPIIYLTTKGELDADTAKYLTQLKKNGSVKNAYVIGGKNVISDDMMKKAGNALGIKATRISGADRFSTCVKVNKAFASTLDGNSICIATGMNFPDALAGGVFAAHNRTPLFLATGNLSNEQTAYLKTKSADSINVFGGTGAVPDNLVKTIAKASV